MPPGRCCLAALVMLAGASSGLAAQRSVEGPEITVLRPDTPVAGQVPDLPHVEPYVVAQPGAPDDLLAGAILVSPARGEGAWRCAVFRTGDAGADWSRHDLPVRRCIDPWVAFTEDGGALFTGIEILEEGEDRQRLHLVVFRSPDGGRTWPNEPVSLGRGFDHELLTVDRRDGTVWLASQRIRRDSAGRPEERAVLQRSRDHGRTFELVSDLRPFALPLRPTGLEVLSDGTLAVTLHDRLPGDAGTTGSRRAWSVVSTDGGRSFSEPRFVTEACGPADGFPGYPFLDVDASDGPYRDRLYHVCVRTGFEGIALVRSGDGGRSWSDAVRVDAPPADGPAHARTAMLAVDGTGVVAVAWYDRRLDPERVCQDLYFTASTDGGETFAEPVRVSTETSCPGAEGNGRVADSWPMGGDYSSLAGLPGGGFHVLWADSRSGVFQLRQARLRVVRGTATRSTMEARP